MPGELHIQQGDLQLKNLLLASTCHSTVLAETSEAQTRFVRSWAEKFVYSVLFPSIIIRTGSYRCEVTQEGVAHVTQLDRSERKLV